MTNNSLKRFPMFNGSVSIVLRQAWKNVNLSFNYKHCKLYAVLSLQEAIPSL